GLRERHRHARTFAHVFLDRVQLLANGVDSFRIDANGQHLIEELHNSGRGAVLLGAHFGSFEALRAFDRSLPGLRVRYLMFPENAQTSTALMSELNTEVADRVISLADGKRAMMEAGEALRRGDFVAFLGDRLPDRTIRSQISVPFLGESIKLPTSPYIVAMVARVPLILCVAPRLGRAHYAIEFSLLDDGAPVERAARSDHIAVLADRYSATLENLCRRYPYNWFNFFDIWGE
ncbi:MAG: acyl-CoA synthetase, partial [Alphaproteobacteria bacterium]|nr:acyl-CoA synthetase [Alphaproteobacteria bacterium]